MTEWRKVKLGDVSCYVNDKIDIASFDNSLYISTDSMLSDKGGITAPESIPTTGKVTKYQFEDILVSNIRPYFKKIWKSNRDGGCSNDVLVFRGNPTMILPTFLYYVLSCDSFFEHMMAGANGTKMPRGNKKLILNYTFGLPDLAVQRRIAEVLSRYDALIENYQRQIKLLEEAAQRLYKEWFVDLRFPGHQSTPIINNLPQSWQKKKLGEIVKTTSGGTPSRGKPEYYTGDILWVKTKELNDSFILDTEEKISIEAINKSSAKILPSGSVLLAMYGATIGKLGIASKKMACNQACCVFLFDDNDVFRWFLYNWLIINRSFLISQGKGAAQPNLSQDMIKNFETIIPDTPLLEKYHRMMAPLYDRIMNNQAQIRNLSEARDRLLPKLMSAKIVF